MYQTGIYNISQLSANVKKEPFIKNRPVALDLYDQISQLEPEKQQTAQERILNFAFSDGSYKKTHFNRFNDFDDKVIEYLEKNLDKNKKCEFHDLAVSDGRTSFDLFLKLEKIFPNLDFFASDKNMFAYVYSDIRNKSRKLVKEESGKILQIILPPFVFNLYSPKNAWRYKIKKAVLFPINILLLEILKIPAVLNFFIKPDEAGKQKITLLQKNVLDLAKTRKNFYISTYDLFRENAEQFDIIRAMNVLNMSYFTPEEIKKITANISASLKEGGIFIVGSNKSAGTPVNGDLIIKKNGCLESVIKFNEGAPFREIILS